MAIPKSLKTIETSKALSILNKHAKDGEYDSSGDFVYLTKRGMYMIRHSPWSDTYETGKVAMPVKRNFLKHEYLFPIPSKDIIVTGHNLEQNPGY